MPTLTLNRRLAFVLAALIFATTAQGQQEREKPDFAHDVAPILKARCGKCHLGGKHEGELALDERAPLLEKHMIVPGKSGDSELYARLVSDDPEERMPSKGPPLSNQEIATIKTWIDNGAEWDAGYRFFTQTKQPPIKPRRPEIPPAQPGLEHPIDRILAQQVTTLKTIDDATYARRVYLDLIGQLPTPDEVDALAKDTSPDKRAALVNRLLNEKRSYADHWLSFWNDLLRNDYQGTGYIDGGRRQITAWLYKSLVDHKPYDQFVRELIAPSDESAGFIDGIKWRGSVNASQTREIQFSQNVSQVFFGINMKCASCHDSFIDTWKLDDAYGLAAITSETPLEIFRCDKPTGRMASPRFVFPELGAIDATKPRAERLAQLAGLVTHPENGRFTRTVVNRIWQRMMGRGIVHPVDVMANPPWNADLLDYLATYLSDNGYDLKALMAHIATSRAYQAACASRKNENPIADYAFRGPEVKRLSAEQFIDAVWMLTGTAPAEPAAKIALEPFAESTPPERRYVRASLTTADLLQRSLGRPNREQVVTTRGDVLTTLQALDLSNGEAVYDLLNRGGERLLKVFPDSDALVKTIYRRALCRAPSDDELRVALDIVGDKPTAESAADLLWAVIMLPEFQHIR